MLLKPTFAALRPLADGARFSEVPVIDMARQRQMLAEATLAHVRSEVDSLVREVDQILTEQGQGRKVRGSTAERYLEEARRLSALVDEFRAATRSGWRRPAGRWTYCGCRWRRWRRNGADRRPHAIPTVVANIGQPATRCTLEGPSFCLW